nr:hypothetical protein [Tanacetum cinerariifolium]
KYNQKEVDELKAERLVKTQDPLALMANSNNPYRISSNPRNRQIAQPGMNMGQDRQMQMIGGNDGNQFRQYAGQNAGNLKNPYAFPATHQDQPSFNQNYMQQPMPNPEDITDPTTSMNMALTLMTKAFKLNYSTPTNNNQRISSNLRNRQIAQPGMNMGQDRQMQMVGGNGNQNLNGNCNLVAARAEGNATGHNSNQIRCYNCRGVGYFDRNCTFRPRRRDAAYLQT